MLLCYLCTHTTLDGYYWNNVCGLIHDVTHDEADPEFGKGVHFAVIKHNGIFRKCILNLAITKLSHFMYAS